MEDLLVNYISNLMGRNYNAQIPLLREILNAGCEQRGICALRLMLQHPDISSLTLMQAGNIWQQRGSPALKPNQTAASLFILSDMTTAAFVRLLPPLAAAGGLDLKITLSDFDSVEQTAIDPGSLLYAQQRDAVLLLLSGEWLDRYLGNGGLAERSAVEAVVTTVTGIIDGIRARANCPIIFCPFLPESWERPCSMVNSDAVVGRQMAINCINGFLAERYIGQDVFMLNQYSPLLRSGGEDALGRTSFLRARVMFESEGIVAFCREVVQSLCGILGKAYRAVVTDWDNTIWGGLVAEDEPERLLCGLDGADEWGYYKVQQYLKGLQDCGILLAGASRNLPQATDIFAKRPDMPLRMDDFSALRVNMLPKSVSIREIARELGFGVEYMLFIDDNVFELAEAVIGNPYLDIMLAGPTPDCTLARLARCRPGHNVRILDSDRERAGQVRALRQQQELASLCQDMSEFLKSIGICLTFSPLSEDNVARVTQLLQKSNQFNLTTRRHTAARLADLVAKGAVVVAVEYSDKFAAQGIVSVVILVFEGEGCRIDTWVMSCRVLNRTVEDAVFAWICDHVGDMLITGEYIPTEKNMLVAGLFKRLGFERCSSEGEGERWRFQRGMNEVGHAHYCAIEDRFPPFVR